MIPIDERRVDYHFFFYFCYFSVSFVLSVGDKLSIMFSVLFIYLLHQRPTCASLFVEMKLV